MHGQTSGWFTVLKGVRQGCLFSPYLFNILVELLMRVALDGYSGGFRISGRLVNNMRYADDIVLVASSETELQELVTRVYCATSETDTRINVRKTRKLKYFDHISRHASLESDIMLGTLTFRRQGGQRKQWIDDLTEWSNKSIPDLVRKAQDRSAYQRFFHRVTHARNKILHLDPIFRQKRKFFANFRRDLENFASKRP